MINTRIGLSLLSIVATLAMMAGATFAFFSDQVTSTGNTFSAGTLNLEIRDNDESFTDAVTASTVSPTGWVPGETFQSYVCFKNDGSTDIQEIILSLNSSGGNAAIREAVIAQTVELGFASEADCEQVSGGSLEDFTPLFVGRFDSGDADSEVSLSELLADVDGTDRSEDDLLDGSSNLLAPGNLIKFRTTWRLDEEAGNNVQGQTVTLDTTFVGQQEEQP